MAGLPRGFPVLGGLRESFPHGLPRRSRLGLNEILIPVRTGPLSDRSMGTLVPTGPTTMVKLSLGRRRLVEENELPRMRSFYKEKVVPFL